MATSESNNINPREVVDFLWEWADSLGDWARTLVCNVVSHGGELTTDERDRVFDCFLQSISLKSGLPQIFISKPKYKKDISNIRLYSLVNVSGVNKLSSNQEVLFGENITIIYGENGTGKTGYSRILKSLGYSYDNYNKILPDIYNSVKSQSATINYKVNDNTSIASFVWDGSNSCPELKTISVFNSNCVHISLSESQRELIVSPVGFHLFNVIIRELIALEEIAKSYIEKYPVLFESLNLLQPGTPQYEYIKGLSSTSNEQKLREIATYTEQDEITKISLEKSLSTLNKPVLETEIKNKKTHVEELRAVKTQINTTREIINVDTWDKIKEIDRLILSFEGIEHVGILDVAASYGIQLFDTIEFKTFISSAEAYIKLLENQEYPSNGDVCAYCYQPLNVQGINLLKSYRSLLNDQAHSELKKLKNDRNTLLLLINDNNIEVKFHLPSFGIDANHKAIQPVQFGEYNQVLLKYKKLCVDKITHDEFMFDYDQYIKIIDNMIIEIDSSIFKMSESLINLEKLEDEYKKQIFELKDRKLLSTKGQIIKTIIANHKVVKKIKDNTNKFNSRSISIKATDAREALITSNLILNFKDELKVFRKQHLEIDFNFGTSKGVSHISNKINSYSLFDILSEGEQKAIAIAEFLAELQLDNNATPVVFDDPVNSLDHHIIDDVARRLLRLSNDRQVIIFTHSVLLFNSLLYFSKQPIFNHLDTKLLNSKSEYGKTGIIVSAEEGINSCAKMIKSINGLINNTHNDRCETDIASDCYGYLRSAIELCVEHEIFGGTVKRYQKNIALTSFIKVKGAILDECKTGLNEIFERCCGYIKAHSNPQEIDCAPKLVEFKADFNEFIKIRKMFIG